MRRLARKAGFAMQTVRELKETIEEERDLAALAAVYEDEALLAIPKIRREVMATRGFLARASRIYSLSKAAYLKQAATLRHREKILSFILRNGKTAVVLISGNQSLLGNLMLSTYKVFWELSQKSGGDLVIAGQIGRYLASGQRPPPKFAYFDLDDYQIAASQFEAIAGHVCGYGKILVVYPKFVTVLSQEPAIGDISGGVTFETSRQATPYFFEPSGEAVMSYFETQVIRMLLRQKILEAMLARYSARLAAMDEASQKVERELIRMRQQLRRLVRRAQNKKQNEIFAGISLWET